MQEHMQKLSTNEVCQSGKNGNSNSNTASKTEWVRLNIGGQHFLTTKTTLCKNHNTFFYKLLQDDTSIALTTDKVLKIKQLQKMVNY